MKIKSIIETTKCMYAVSNDVDTIFNKMNEPYFFADTLFSKDEESDLPRFSSALADAETNDHYKDCGGEPIYVVGHMQVLFNTSKIEKVYPMDREISGVEE
ncbi:hypothetical protein ACQRBI_03145 [Lactobacillus johnsonii]|uniref:hypothetical protein n=1 Tax=Lactobacillus johnsonii TaxID=33959 RepID=UPI003D05AA41